VNVIYAPSGQVIGQADTERGALQHASRIPRMYPRRERYTASVREVIDRRDMPDFTRVWVVGLRLVTS
jgi:hypothetical protein